MNKSKFDTLSEQFLVNQNKTEEVTVSISTREVSGNYLFFLNYFDSYWW